MALPNQTGAVRELFGSDADRYDARHYGTRYRTFIGDRQKLVNRVFQALAVPAGTPVLDVACGPGHFLHAAVTAGGIPVGIDSSPDMLRTSGKRVGPRARLVQGDAQMLPFETGSFGLLNCSGLIEYIPDPTQLLREFRRVLRPGGYAMVSSTNSLSPAHLLAPVEAALKRSALVRRLIRALNLPFDELSLKQRPFRMTYHTPGRLARQLRGAGFDRVNMHYCHLQLFPHPLEHVMPALTTACVAVTDMVIPVPPLRAFAEGLLAVGFVAG